MHLPQSESVFPLRDDIQSQRVPIVNYSLIAACVLAYALQLNNPDGLVEEFGMIPARVSHPNSILTVQAQHSVQTPQGLEVTIVERQIPPSVYHTAILRFPAWKRHALSGKRLVSPYFR